MGNIALTMKYTILLKPVRIILSLAAITVVLLIVQLDLSILLKVLSVAVFLLLAVWLNEDEIFELRAAEQRCRMVAETAQVYIQHTTLDGTVIYMNKFAEEVSGYSRDEIIGKNFLDIFVPPEYRDVVLADMGMGMTGGILRNREAPLMTKDGEMRIMLWSGAGALNHEGHLIGLVVSGIDITDLKKVQNALQESESRYRSLADNTLVPIYIVKNQKIIFANKSGQELLGYTLEELEEMNPLDTVHPDDRLKLDEYTQRGLRGEDLPERFPIRIIRKNGEIRDVEIWAVRTAMEGEDAVLVNIIDTTEIKRYQNALRESEVKYKTLVDHSLTPIFIVQDNKFVFANRSAEEISGYTAEEARHVDFWHLVHPDDRKIMIERAARRLRGEPEPERYEYRMLTKHGETRTVEIWATLISYEGKPAIMANVIDITERKQAEEQRLLAERELAEHKRQLYREAILALTGNKLEVVEPEQAYEAVKDAKLKVNIDTPKDVSLARHLIRELAVNNGMTGDRLESYILAVGEATVNAVKHGESGVVYSDISDGKIYTGVIDNGPGMDTFVLTRAALQQGFSTKPSLGLGYSFILSGSDYVMLATSKTGTAVVMWKSLEKAPEPSPIDLSRLPDAW